MKPITKVYLYTLAFVASIFVIPILSIIVLSDLHVYSDTTEVVTCIVLTLIPAAYFFYRAWVVGKPIREERKKLLAETEHAAEQGEDIKQDENDNNFSASNLICIFILPILIVLFYESNIVACVILSIVWLISLIKFILMILVYAKRKNKGHF
ncbi:MAG: hypothetical protein IJT12_06435 [Paludibacteraceae bacterium]|nr:hypothetical protein [Paludibacteraceae bacterium]